MLFCSPKPKHEALPEGGPSVFPSRSRRLRFSAARMVAASLAAFAWAAPIGAQESAPAAPTQEALPQHLRSLGAMGTELVIEVYHADEIIANAAIDAAIAEIACIEDMMTSWRDSPLTRMNEHAGQGWYDVPRPLARLLARGLAVAELTNGAFDPTFASAGKLWDFKADPPKVPTAEQVREALRTVGFNAVQIDLEQNRVKLPEGYRVGLGGIAKGYGVDRAMQVLMEHGIEHAMVNAGGDLKVLGQKQGQPWRIAVRHPRAKERIIAMVPLANTCIVTSGDYERFFLLDGQRYHHILDPRTGYPAQGAISATVIAPDAAFADALATAMVVMGPKAGLPILEKLPRVEGLIIDLEGQVHATTGLQARVQKPAQETSEYPADGDSKATGDPHAVR